MGNNFGRKKHNRSIAGTILSLALCLVLMFGMLSAFGYTKVRANEPQAGKKYVGDIDCDGKITPKDLTLLKRYLQGNWKAEAALFDADMDGDGELTPKDVTLLRRYLAGGFNVTLKEKVIPAGVVINKTNFPDFWFRVLVRNNFDLDHNDVLSEEEIAEVHSMDAFAGIYAYNELGVDENTTQEEWDEAIDAYFRSGNGIKSFKGIEFFAELESIWFYKNPVKELDLSKNTKLRNISCYENLLESLDISGCTDLVDLDCGENKLTELDLSNNTNLEVLYLRNNKLNSIDLSANSKLIDIDVFGNPMESLDLSAASGIMEGGFMNVASGMTVYYRGTEYYYDNDCRLNKIIQKDTAGKTTWESYDFTYDEAGRDTGHKEKDAEGRTWKYTYTYHDETGEHGEPLMKSEECVCSDGREWLHEYDTNGIMYFETWTDPDGHIGTKLYRGDGTIQTEYHEFLDGATEEWTFDENGVKTEAVRFDSEGEREWTHTDFIYNDNEWEIGYTEENRDGIFYECTFTYYPVGTGGDDWGHLKTELRIGEDGTEIQREYYENGHTKTDIWKSAAGDEHVTLWHENGNISYESWTNSDGSEGMSAYREDGTREYELWTNTDGSTDERYFDEEGIKTEEIRYNSKDEVEYTRTDFTFDENGDETGCTEVNSDGYTYIWTYTYYPRAEGEDWSHSKTDTKVGSNGHTWGCERYYDGQWSKEWWKDSDGSEGERLFREDGSRTSEWNKDQDGYTNESTFDGNNKKVKEVRKDPDGKVEYTRTGYTFDENGYEIGCTEANSDGNTYTWTYTYYPRNSEEDWPHYKSESRVGSDGRSWGCERYYDGTWSRECWKNPDGSEGETLYREDGTRKSEWNKDENRYENESTFDENGIKIKEVRKDPAGNVEYTRTNYTFDEHGAESGFTEVDKDGKTYTCTFTYYPREAGEDWSHNKTETRVCSDGTVWGCERYYDGQWSAEWWIELDGSEHQKEYREDGTRISEFYMNSDGSSEYRTYDENDNEVTYQWKDTEGNIIRSGEIEYDEDGKRMREEWTDFDGTTVIATTTHTYTYYDSGKLKREDRTTTNGDSWYSEYNEQGIRVYEKRWNHDNTAGSYSEYGNDGVQIKGGWYDPDGSQTDFTCDENGNKAIEIRKENGEIVYTRTDYVYNEMNRDIAFTELNSFGEKYRVTRTYYPDEDCVMYEEWEGIEDTVGKNGSYEFYPNGYWKTQYWENPDGSYWKEDFRNDGAKISEERGDSEGYTEYYTYDEFGDELTYYKTDPDGNVIESRGID